MGNTINPYFVKQHIEYLICVLKELRKLK